MDEPRKNQDKPLFFSDELLFFVIIIKIEYG